MSGDAEFSIPVDFLRERYKYDPSTGAITLRGSKSRKRCGSVSKAGYRVMKVSYGGRRVQIAAHKVAWAIHHGVMPDHDVDHKDLNRRNNRIKNLRKATRSQNLVNRPNVGAYPKGVTKSRSKKKPFQAQVTINGVYTYLGCYTTAEEAHAAYLKHAAPPGANS
uniref:HNH nuclease domain-containing protein n=1 Tax=Caulobacter phage BL57 TaxID=3348355 RepID=A0AB74UGU2_9VIRU